MVLIGALMTNEEAFQKKKKKLIKQLRRLHARRADFRNAPYTSVHITFIILDRWSDVIRTHTRRRPTDCLDCERIGEIFAAASGRLARRVGETGRRQRGEFFRGCTLRIRMAAYYIGPRD